jgi:hypothetical protein
VDYRNDNSKYHEFIRDKSRCWSKIKVKLYLLTVKGHSVKGHPIELPTRLFMA